MPSLVGTFFHQFALTRKASPATHRKRSGAGRHRHDDENIEDLTASINLGETINTGYSTESLDYVHDVNEFNKLVRGLLPPRGARFSHDHHDTCVYIERSKNANLVVYQVNLVDAQTGQAVTSGAGRMCRINEKDPVHAHWLKIDPHGVAKRRAHNDMSDIAELRMIERRRLFGMRCSPLPYEKLLAEVQAIEPEQELRLADKEVLALWHKTFQPMVFKCALIPSWPLLLLRLPPVTDDIDESARNLLASLAARDGEATPHINPQAHLEAHDTMCVLIGLFDEDSIGVVAKLYVKYSDSQRLLRKDKMEYVEMTGISLSTGAQVQRRK